jgi:hypothetical protein
MVKMASCTLTTKGDVCFILGYVGEYCHIVDWLFFLNQKSSEFTFKTRRADGAIYRSKHN